MATTSYITPITDRTLADVEYARLHQDDLENKNKGVWNYTDVNRICNNLKYAAEYMYEQGFLLQPYTASIKTDWTETDIITFEQLNTMIVDNINNLKTYSRPDLKWHHIPSIISMDYTVANWLEENIHQLATQEPLPHDTFTLTVNNGSGSGEYVARTKVTIQANSPLEGEVFDYWSGDHLENVNNPKSAITTYEMPYSNATLTAHYTADIPHTLTVITNSETKTYNLKKGESQYIEADPARLNTVFYDWQITPNTYINNLHVSAASTYFVMPNENVTLKSRYKYEILKTLSISKGYGSGSYTSGTDVSIYSKRPSANNFLYWRGSGTDCLLYPITQEYNTVRIPYDIVRDDDAQAIRPYISLTAVWEEETTPLVENVNITVHNGYIQETGTSSGAFTEKDYIYIIANPPSEGKIFDYWYPSIESGGTIWSKTSSTSSYTVGTIDAEIWACYRDLVYYDITVSTFSGTTTNSVEKNSLFSVDARPLPTGYRFVKWQELDSTSNSTSISFSMKTEDLINILGDNRTLTAVYELIPTPTLTVKQPSGDMTYTGQEGEYISIIAESASSGYAFKEWNLSGGGSLSYTTDLGYTRYRFGNEDATLTPLYDIGYYINIINGKIVTRYEFDSNERVSPVYETSVTACENAELHISARTMQANEYFNGWLVEGSRYDY